MAALLQARSLAHALLAAVALGGILLTALLAPNAFQMLGRRHRRDEWWTEREANRKRIREALERLHRKRLVTYHERGKETFIKVTEEGHAYLKKFEFDDMRLRPAGRWDGKWRMVIFDIPETLVRERNALRQKLRDLGFHQLQKSAWIYPHECHDEIDSISQFLAIDRHVVYLESESVGQQEGKARKVFNLL